ncbi:MAG: YhcH/YjgK/YiaL family protein [Bacteroidia bacterium]
MILDTLNNAAAYTSLHPSFGKAFDYLKKIQERDFDKSKEEIEGEDCFALFFKTEGKNPENILSEAHRNYIDIQYIFKGTDTMAFKPISECSQVHTAYVEKDDYMLFKDETLTRFTVTENCFTIFFPADVHAPLIGKEPVWKVVVKVKV